MEDFSSCSKLIDVLRILLFVLFTALLLFFSNPGYCTDYCSLDDQQILLYKIINWWYDARSAGGELCDSVITCRNSGVINFDVTDENGGTHATLQMMCVPLMSFFTNCEMQQSVSSPIPAAYTSDQYRDAEVTLVITEFPTTNNCLIRFENISRDAALTLEKQHLDLVFIVTGKVQGLGKGKIALNSHGDCFGKCKGVPAGTSTVQVIDIELVDSKTQSIVVRFSIRK